MSFLLPLIYSLFVLLVLNVLEAMIIMSRLLVLLLAVPQCVFPQLVYFALLWYRAWLILSVWGVQPVGVQVTDEGNGEWRWRERIITNRVFKRFREGWTIGTIVKGVFRFLVGTEAEMKCTMWSIQLAFLSLVKMSRYAGMWARASNNFNKARRDNSGMIRVPISSGKSSSEVMVVR